MPAQAELLNRYLAKLQAGGRPDRAAFLRDHPELASALRCLEVLEDMAPLPVGEDGLEAEIAAAWQSAQGELPRDFGAYELLARDRPRRHGRGLQGAAKGPRPARGLEDDPGQSPGLGGAHPPFPERGPGGGPAAPLAHRADPRGRSNRRAALLHHGVYRGGEPRRADRPRAGPRADGGAAAQRGGPGGRASSSAGDRPSRLEALEYSAGRRGGAVRDRFRPGEDISCPGRS